MTDQTYRLFGRLFTPTDRGLATVTIDPQAGTVAGIEATRRQPRDAMGGAEMLIIPGLVDLQINGAFGQDFSNPGADLAAVCRGLPRFGVTAFLPTIISSAPEVYGPCLANLRAPAGRGGARVLGAHVEGPFLSPARAGTHEPSVLRDPSWAEAERWLGAGPVRILTLAPELPGALPLARELVRRGVVVALGHSDATSDQARLAVEAGASLGTHLFNAMRPFHHRDPGIAGYLLASDVAVSVIGDGVHLGADTLRLVALVKSPRELVLVTDGVAGLGLEGGRFELGGRELVGDGVVARLPDGTLSGSLLPLNLAVRNLVEFGVPIVDAVSAATRNPARVLRERRELGRIRVGGSADLVVLDPDWGVLLTLVGGDVAYDKGDMTARSPGRAK